MILADSKTALESWLSFVSILIWQALGIIDVILFRQQLSRLIGRISSVKAGGGEVAFQAQTDEATRPRQTGESVVSPGPDGFLSAASVRELIEKSDLLEDGERIQQVLLLFATDEQRTWLLATDRRLFYVLDDQDTQSSGEFVQRAQRFTEIRRVKAIPEDTAVGEVIIGPEPGWYYSVGLHPNPTALEARILAMIGKKPCLTPRHLLADPHKLQLEDEILRRRQRSIVTARSANRTAQAYKVWRDEPIIQSAVARILACVFGQFVGNDVAPGQPLGGFCRSVGAEPMICVNSGDGTAGFRRPTYAKWVSCER